MVKALTFKGDKKTKKRKRVDVAEKFGEGEASAGKEIASVKIGDAAPVDDDSWVTAEGAGDVVGPIIFVLPSDTPSCMACDTTGKVFASPLENIIDNDPSTAEPHDVRQVWVANKIVGTDTYTFKGHHGKYLGCDKYGILSANTEAVSPLETFLCIPTADTPGTFQIQNLRETFVTIKPSTSSKANALPEIRGDGESITFNTTLRIRMQARFKPKLKANKEEKAREKISRKELEEAVGRKLEDDEKNLFTKSSPPHHNTKIHPPIKMYTLDAISAFHVSSPENTYIYDIVPVSGGLAAISSDDSLRVLNPLALNGEPINSVRRVNTDVTCLKAVNSSVEGDAVVVCTAGRDGRVCLVDVRTGSRVAEVRTDQNAPVLSLACSFPNSLAAGTELTNHQASVLIWDTRELSQPIVQYIESHSDDVTELQFHPSRSQILLSGSTDGLVNIYNTTISDEEDALHQTINHGHSIHHANFLSDVDIFALSHDEKFSMYELVTNSEEGVEEPLPVHFGDMRELLGGEYVANVLRRPDGSAVLGIGTHSRESFDLVQLKNNLPWAFVPESKVTLPGAHSSEIVRSFCFLDSHKTVLTAGEDGQDAWNDDHTSVLCFRHEVIALVRRSQDEEPKYAAAAISLVFLQIILPVTLAQVADDHKTTVIADGSPQPSVAAQSPTPQKPLRDGENGHKRIDGTEQVEKALIFLRRYERLNPKPARKPSGALAQVGYYALALLPKLYIQGPGSDGSVAGFQVNKVPKMVGEAVQLLEEAAQVNNSDAMYLLAQLNFYGNYSHPKDYPEAFRRYHQLASLNGNSSAQHMIGFMYATGIGGAVERDQAKALLYHTFAAKGGNVRAEMTVAFRHHSGIGTARNCDVAIKHYKNVADKAIEWYRSGPPGGMSWVPDSYRLADDDGGVYGEGASFSSAGSNANKASPSHEAHAALDDVLEYLDLMSRKGDFKATFNLGRIHYDGQRGLPRNLKSAKWYFMRVAKMYWHREGRVIETDKPGLEKVASKAAGYLGKMFLRGEGAEQNFEKANVWFQRGIKGGDAMSQYGSGLMYLDGLGVPKNTVKATDLFKAAAKEDYAPALVSIAALYLDQGDPKVANSYFELAARYGNIESYYYLAELIGQGVGRDRSCGLATAYYKSVAEKAEPLLSSFTEANRAYENEDHELALIDYMFAAEQGYEKAQANVAYILDRQKSKWALPSWLSLSSPRSNLLQNAALALVYWTRSAKQTNIDSMVKMGDYYLKGIGTEPDTEKAVTCYNAASEFHQSAQALFNLGWMHENGIGLDQDFHLAKRFYDHALETNEEAYLPVTLSLFKLRLRSAWNTFTNGRVNSIQDEPAPKKQWSLSEWISNFIQDDHPYYGDTEYDDNFLPEGNHIPGGDSDGFYEDIIDDGILESLIIIGLAAALVFLVYYRQQHQLRHRRGEEAARAQGDLPAPQGQEQQRQEERGVFPQPGDPEFGHQPSNVTMSTPAAKKRRIDTASQTLSKPFRSPFKTPFKSPLKGTQAPNNTPVSTSKTSFTAASRSNGTSKSILSNKTPNLSLHSTPARPKKKTFSSPVAAAALNADPDIAPLLRAQRELERTLKGVREELDVAEQARKIEGESRRKRGDGSGEIDGELVVLIEKWKGASRLAAEEMFGKVRDRVNRMGGPRAWKEMQKKQEEWQNNWEQEDAQANNNDSDDDEDNEVKPDVEKRDLYAKYDIDPETENEKSQRAKGLGDTGERPGEEDEFTMAMMLRTLNVDLDVIGYDREQQRSTTKTRTQNAERLRRSHQSSKHVHKSSNLQPNKQVNHILEIKPRSSSSSSNSGSSSSGYSTADSWLPATNTGFGNQGWNTTTTTSSSSSRPMDPNRFKNGPPYSDSQRERQAEIDRFKYKGPGSLGAVDLQTVPWSESSWGGKKR
ncbi:hypothetical protein G7Y89_g5643 [Cudoniella acicularis]|uniref:Uncharacterized protein n=1 Tax=Cudoniella acicularis TaxID=354080 RepID=A0A8H4RP98_9HELO|nr:hypothetical protein G7Y89_g5643 [Cudoniella acicularis]